MKFQVHQEYLLRLRRLRRRRCRSGEGRLVSSRVIADKDDDLLRNIKRAVPEGSSATPCITTENI
jgi:hypothetical protein